MQARRNRPHLFYQQITDDAGARLGAVEGRTVGVGPVGSALRRIGGATLAAEAEWLPDIEVEHRPKGDLAWLELALLP